jgi:drug/metabolite transporter (DMT)-like permease
MLASAGAHATMRALNAPPPHPRRAIVCAAAAIALWAALALLALKLKHVPPFLLVGCALLLGSTLGMRRASLRATRPGVLLLGIYGLFAYHFCLFVALRWAPPVEANLLNYLWPLLIVVLSPVVLPGTTLRPRHVAGAVLGFSGAAMLIARGGGDLGLSGTGSAGYLLALAAAVIWSTYSLLTKRVAPFPTSSIAIFCLASGLLSLACHAAFEPRYVPTLSDAPYLLLVGLGPMGAAFYLWDVAMKEGDPRAIGTLAYATPLLSTLLIAAFGEGTLTPAALVGAAFITSGAVIGTR